MEISGFRIVPVAFMGDHISVPNFSFLGHLEVLHIKLMAF